MFRVYVKGASEIVLESCSFIDTVTGPCLLTEADRESIRTNVIEAYAKDALRVILLAYRDVPEQSWNSDELLVKDLTISCLVGIQDPLRPEVPAAVAKCKNAGVVVRMVTGDNKLTGAAIARQCGIISSEDGDDAVMEGPDFRRRVMKENGEIDYVKLQEIAPKLRVLARCSPTDKFTLVKGLKYYKDVVAVTGDGTNDGPALAEADVGFSMGTGTKVAQSASDIVIMDDNFSSLVAAISWGRNVYDSISKFLIFQLTVNVVAILTAIIGAASIQESPLRAIQLLFVNLIMDSFASLALATESPTPALLDRKPYPRNQPLISQHMFKQIFGHSVYQLTWVLVILYAGDVIWNVPSGRNLPDGQKSASEHYTMVFNTFVWMQIFNEINARKCHGELNVFEGILKNPIFCIIWIGTCIVMALIVEFGGSAFHVTPLPYRMWLSSIAIGFGGLLWNVFLHFVIPDTIIPLAWATGTSQAEVMAIEEPDINAPPQSDVIPSVVSLPQLGILDGLEAPLGRVIWHRGFRRLRTQIRIAAAFKEGALAAEQRRVENLPAYAASVGKVLWNRGLRQIRSEMRVAAAFKEGARIAECRRQEGSQLHNDESADIAANVDECVSIV